MNHFDDRPIQHLPRFSGVILIMALAANWGTEDAIAKDGHDSVLVQSPRMLGVEKIPCERIPLGEPEDYKACVAVCPSAELLLVMFHQHQKDDGKVLEENLLFRSVDGGKTWSGPKKLDLVGREPFLTVLKDGTIFMTGHLASRDVRNRDGYVHSYLHRSQDGGCTWSTMRIEPEEFRPRIVSLTTRNVLEMADGSLLLGVSEHAPESKTFMWRSLDKGQTWPEKYPARFEDVPKDYPWTILGEAHLWQARSGKIYAILRVGANNSWPLPGTTDPGANDQSERMVVYASADRGRNWRKVRDLGGYGQMYPSITRLGGDRLLLTFTQRAVSPPLGVRAVLGRETEDGFAVDLERDQIMLDTKTPLDKASGGGFGPTVQLKDGTLVTSYTYRGADNRTHAEIVRWRLPEAK